MRVGGEREPLIEHDRKNSLTERDGLMPLILLEAFFLFQEIFERDGRTPMPVVWVEEVFPVDVLLGVFRDKRLILTFAVTFAMANAT
ncbi:uncharacterized protein G2W53_035129 [Senna tora]|uniref:Uncharacterized protein n=1 Tax=Senna tora TaxID=362788 RepID=A0A834W793_9FABA|nr:uncharacterized protein G2W53_035129 [Senna tora]